MAAKHKENNVRRICILGASFDTGNLGVNALAESSIKVILNRWQEAEITFFGSGLTPNQSHLHISGREICVQMIPVRFSKNVFLPYHFVWFVLYGLLSRILLGERAKRILLGRNPYVRTLYETDLAVDITGGDSFSDIYGFKRFLLGAFRKWLIILFDKRLVFMPQTYGPFKRFLAKGMARYILNRASLVYSRDLAGIEYVNRLLGSTHNAQVRFAPDVAFVLDPRRPDSQDIDSLEEIRDSNKILVGLNVSGLLSCSSDGKDNVFGLRVDYSALVSSIVESLMKRDDTAILLVPHVVALQESDALPPKSVPKKGYREQSDRVACGSIYEEFSAKYSDRIFLVRGQYNHNETKYIIGLCDFFVGARMHACIAALSQGIPTVGIAYSRKFQGVFESIGVGDCVADARCCGQEEMLAIMNSAFQRMDQLRTGLSETVARAQSKVLNMFGTTEP